PNDRRAERSDEDESKRTAEGGRHPKRRRGGNRQRPSCGTRSDPAERASAPEAGSALQRRSARREGLPGYLPDRHGERANAVASLLALGTGVHRAQGGRRAPEPRRLPARWRVRGSAERDQRLLGNQDPERV